MGMGTYLDETPNTNTNNNDGNNNNNNNNNNNKSDIYQFNVDTNK